ncbi:hypothetical protein FNH22_09360 [Fulvivirga sp. M361]|uniref:YgjV family protein n=1 Tax=Fulvivirga sp. M361 TaxID=2594266 RepID=UPI00117B8756|nr:hypothetical protein FNH22_09360 [Fulvivirga sp. M361]
MVDIFGYLAVGIGLFAVTKKSLLSFRLWHVVSCLCYMVYGILNPAYPILVSGALFIVIHLYRLNKIKPFRNNKNTPQRG